MASDNIIDLNDTDFKEVISESNIPVLVDFGADWCGPCKMIYPVLKEIAAEYEGKVQVGKLNVEENKNVPSSLKVISIPTLIIFKDGQELDRSIGYKTQEDLRRFIDSHL
ncbi:MAG: thioredoxin [Desulfotomaculaceae bacterium]|nr:thioredoxin [Desulfotomaculaceae bacterium]